ncbi:MAG: hypothetical protein FWH52_07745, partial [Synergistaceae bacterium]|nr:hypothetical protein [Synergistaceae bacterium]
PGSRSDPLSLNLYTYCVNNPLRYHDPNGHAYVPITLASGKTAYINDYDVGSYVMNGKSGSAAVIQSGQTANTVNFKGDIINLGTVVTANIGDNTYYNYGGTTTVNMNNGTVNNYGTIGDIYVNGGNATVNNSGNIDSIYSNGSSNYLNVITTGGSVDLIDSGNSNLLVNKIGGTIGLIKTSSGDSSNMHAVTYNNYTGGASILSVSSDWSTAQSRATELLRASGGGKSTASIVSAESMRITGSSPFVVAVPVRSFFENRGATVRASKLLLDRVFFRNDLYSVSVAYGNNSFSFISRPEEDGKIYYDYKTIIFGLGMAISMSDMGLNYLANHEVNAYGSYMNYDSNSDRLLSIEPHGNDIGYGFDYKVNNVPAQTVTANEAIDMLRNITATGADAITSGVNRLFTQNQLDALVVLRYNIGFLGNIPGFISVLESGNYDRSEFQGLIDSYYDSLVEINSGNAASRSGWQNRTNQTLDIFFDNNYGSMQIDAVNGRLFK